MPSENLTNASTTEYSVTRSYNTASGLMQLPVNGGQSRVVRLCTDMQQMVISWTATREGGPPTAPHPLTFANDLNTQLLSCSVGAAMPIEMGPGMGRGWQLSGVYTYAIKAPLAYGCPINTGKMPWNNSGVLASGETNVDAVFFRDDLLSQQPIAPLLAAPIIDPNP